MKEIQIQIKLHRKTTDSSIKSYSSNMKNLALAVTGRPYKNNNFLKSKYEEVIKVLDEKALSTRRNYTSSILVFLSPTGRGKYQKGYAKTAGKYSAYLIELAKQYEAKSKEQSKSAKQEKNWSTMDALKGIMKGYQMDIKDKGYSQKCVPLKKKSDLYLIQKYLVCGLYLLIPPRRNVYAGVKMISAADYKKVPDDSKDNYLVVVNRNKKYFQFNNYKTVKTHGKQKVDVPKALNTIINLWRCYNKTEHLLLNSRGSVMTENAMTKFIQKTFAKTKKKISSTMIRHIYLTEKYGDQIPLSEKEDDAVAMGHSVDTQQGTYVKVD